MVVLKDLQHAFRRGHDCDERGCSRSHLVSIDGMSVEEMLDLVGDLADVSLGSDERRRRTSTGDRKVPHS